MPPRGRTGSSSNPPGSYLQRRDDLISSPDYRRKKANTRKPIPSRKLGDIISAASDRKASGEKSSGLTKSDDAWGKCISKSTTNDSKRTNGSLSPDTQGRSEKTVRSYESTQAWRLQRSESEIPQHPTWMRLHYDLSRISSPEKHLRSRCVPSCGQMIRGGS